MKQLKHYRTPDGILYEDEIAAIVARTGVMAASKALGIPKSTMSDIWRRNRAEALISERARAAATSILDSQTAESTEDVGRALTEVQSIRAENTLLRGQLRTRTRQQDGIFRAVENVFDASSMPEIRLVTSSPPATPGESPCQYPVVLLSDTQIGKITPGYNPGIARLRVQEYAARAVRVLDVMSKGAKIPYIEVWLAGDMVEGESIFPNQPYHIEEGVGRQALQWAPTIMSEFILAFASAGYKVKVRCVAGNHGRDGSKHAPHHDSTNWDLVSYRVTELLCGSGKIPRSISDNVLSFDITEYFYTVVRMPGEWGVMLTHGDRIRGGGNSGTFEKKVNGWIQAIPEPFDYVVTGHFHRPVNWPCGKIEFITNGTTEEPEGDFLQGEIASTNRACQRMLVFHEQHGLIDDKKFYLDGHFPRK